MRTLMSLAIVVSFFALTGATESADKKKTKDPSVVTGTVANIDAVKGFITLQVETRNKKEKTTSNPQYKVDDDTKLILDGNKEVMGKDGLKNIKEGSQVTVTLGNDFKTLSIKVGRR